MIDLSVPIRVAILNDPTLAGMIPQWLSTRSVHTRRPLPEGAPLPAVVISPNVSVGDLDMVSEQMPVIVRDVAVYGRNDDPAKYFAVEDIANRIRDLFHRNRFALTATGWRPVSIVCSGPFAAPTDDDQLVGRVVTLTVNLTET